MALNDIIREAQRLSGAPRNVTAIVNQMMHGRLWNELVDDPTVHRVVMRDGLNKQARDFIKHRLAEIIEGERILRGTSKDQLELWPEGLHRSLVKRIDAAAVFVPSVDEFRDLTPATLSPIQAKEAGRYLIKMARDVGRRGKALIDLGELGW